MNTKQLCYGLLILWLLIACITYSEPVPTERPACGEARPKGRRDVGTGWPGEIPAKIKEGLTKPLPKITLAKKVEIRTYLAALALIGNINIVATDAVLGEMAIFLKGFEGVTVGEMLEVVLVTNKLAMEIKGNIITIMSEAEFEKLYGRPYNETRSFKIIKLEHIQPSRMAKALEAIKSPTATIIMDDASMNLIIIEYPEKLRQMETIITTTDVVLVTKTFEPNYAKVATLAALLTTTQSITPEVGEMKTDTRTNRLIITDTPENLKRISELITTLDAKPRQVLIEARMVKIELKDTYYTGINWKRIFSKVDINAEYPNPGHVTEQPVKTFRAVIGTMATDNYEATLAALQEYGDTKLIASPRLIILNNQQASFIVGRDEVIMSTQQTIAEGGTVTLKDIVEWKEVGVSLSVSPTINANAFITMHLKPEISAVVDHVVSGATGNVYPIIEKTNVQTDVIVKDGVTIVIGGLVRDERREYRRGIPLLQDLPLVGWLFRNTGIAQEKTETVIFLTPYIVSGEADTSVISKQEEMIRKRPKDIREIK